MWIKNDHKKLRLASVESEFLEIWLFFFHLKNRRDEEKNWIGSQTIGRYLDSIHRQNSFFSFKLSIFTFFFNFFLLLGRRQTSPYLFWVVQFCILCMKYSNFLPELHKNRNAFKQEGRKKCTICVVVIFFFSLRPKRTDKNEAKKRMIEQCSR